VYDGRQRLRRDREQDRSRLALVTFGGRSALVVAAVLVYRFLSTAPVLVVAAAGGLLWNRPGAQQLAEWELSDASSTASGEATIATRKNPG